MYKICINVPLIIFRGGILFCLKLPTQKSIYHFYEIPINTSSDMVLGCGFSFSVFSAIETDLTFWKMGFWVFSGGWDMFFWQHCAKMKYKRTEKRWRHYKHWPRRWLWNVGGTSFSFFLFEQKKRSLINTFLIKLSPLQSLWKNPLLFYK